MTGKLKCRGRPASLIILAGGKSLRMKTDKAGLPLPEGTLIHRILGQTDGLFDEILISVSPGQRPPGEGLRTVEDEGEGRGPIAGILAGLKSSRNDVCAVLACDIPDIHSTFLASLIRKARNFDIVVPVSPGGLREPLFAVYSKSVIPEIESLIRAGDFSLLALLERCRTRCIRMKDSSWLRNLNTPEDYEAFLKSLEAKNS